MAKARNIQKICLHCFESLGDDGVCLSCRKSDAAVKTPAHRLPPRTLLRKQYLIVRTLGEGGFGITYLAWNIKTGKRVAVKEYYPGNAVTRDAKTLNMVVRKRQQFAALSRGLERFIDEAKTLSRLNNLKGIVSVLDFFPMHNTAYLVMEYLDGLSLKRYAQRKGRMDTDTVLTILKPVVMSLREVHKLGLIHRDISPDNIIITRENEVKLIDFGAAKQISADEKNLSVILKQAFAPEEQYRKHGEQGPWTDIYALGVTIYYCITGQLPPESIQRLYQDTLISPSELNAEITPAQEDSLMHSLAVNHEDRYRDLETFIEDFYERNKKGRAPDADKPAPIEEQAYLPELTFDNFDPVTDFMPHGARPVSFSTLPVNCSVPPPDAEESAAAYYENLTLAAPLPRFDNSDPLLYYQHITNELAFPTDVDELPLPSPVERLAARVKSASIQCKRMVVALFTAIGKCLKITGLLLKYLFASVFRAIGRCCKWLGGKIHNLCKAIGRGTRYIYYKFADEPEHNDDLDLDDEG